MYRIFMTNFNFYKDGLYETLEEAKAAAKKTGFETTIMLGEQNVGGFYGVNLTWKENKW